MAIVNEDVRMVKLLLDYGANVHERCLGSCWMPDDQKAETNIVLRKLLTRDHQTAGAAMGDVNSEFGNKHSTSSILELDSNQLSNNSVTNYDG